MSTPAQLEDLLRPGPHSSSEGLVEEVVISGSKREVRASLGSSGDWALCPECQPHQRASLSFMPLSEESFSKMLALCLTSVCGWQLPSERYVSLPWFSVGFVFVVCCCYFVLFYKVFLGVLELTKCARLVVQCSPGICLSLPTQCCDKACGAMPGFSSIWLFR